MKKLALISTLVAATFATTAFANSAQGGFQDPNAPQQMSEKSGKHHDGEKHRDGDKHRDGKEGKRGDKYQGGFIAADQPVSKVTDVASMKDDQFLVLQGKVVQQVGKKDFLFRDASGEITVEIERKAWRGQEVTPSDEVKLYGKVDKSWNKTEVEIDRVQKIQ